MRTAIITSLLDNDFYNFTMGQLIWRHYAHTPVTYQLTNRTTAIKLGELVQLDDLRAEIAAARRLRFTAVELDYLRSLGVFDSNYLTWLADFRLPAVVPTLGRDGQLDITYEADWATAIFWETPMLAIVNELANRARMNGRERQIQTDARRRLEVQLDQFAANPTIRFMEFGTRRRFSRRHQDYVVGRVLDRIPSQLVGTSNVALARKYGLAPTGTMAHQLFMVTTALARRAGDSHPIATSEATALDQFEAEFGHVSNGQLLVFLPDTYGTQTGLRLLGADRAERWTGIRQDSGDPFEQVQTIIDYYRSEDIDPLTKRIIPSDGLDVTLMARLEQAFGQQTQLMFGLGTHLTNDTLVPPLSIVIKPIMAAGRLCGKLSDNRAKATGAPEVVAMLRREADYHTGYTLAPTV